MSKLCVIFLFVSICIAFAPATGIIKRLRNKLQPQQPQVVENKEIYIVEQRPCKSPNCRPDYGVDQPCQSNQCNRCRTECYGNDRCLNDCFVVERCRSNCNGNDRCANECNIPKVVYVPVPEYDRCKSNQCSRCRTECSGNDRCQSNCFVVEQCRNNCNGNYQCINQCDVPQIAYSPPDRCNGCGALRDNPILTNCPSGKTLYFVQVPKNVSLNDIVSNGDLLGLYNDSNLELDTNGIAGRACLNDKTKSDLQHLNATIQPVTQTKK